MGHAPAGPVPEEGQGDDVPRRQHRGTGHHPAALAAARRARLARLGEDLAASFLRRRGAAVLARNVRSGRGEIDLVVRFGAEPAAVEVRTRSAGPHRPEFNFDPAKAARVRRTASGLGLGRVDLVEVTVRPDGADVRWVPRAG